jgi:hypothetical protein
VRRGGLGWRRTETAAEMSKSRAILVLVMQRVELLTTSRADQKTSISLSRTLLRLKKSILLFPTPHFAECGCWTCLTPSTPSKAMQLSAILPHDP